MSRLHFALASLGLFASSLVVFPAPAAAANSNVIEVNLNSAEAFAHEALEFWHQQHLMGDFVRGRFAQDDELFEAADRLVAKINPNQRLQVKRMSVRAESIKFETVDLESGRSLWLSSVAQESLEHTTESSRFEKSVHLVIEEGTRWENTSSGSFVTLTRGTATRLEGGRTYGPFSVSIFGAQAGETSTLGVAGAITLQGRNGLSFSVCGELSQDFNPSLNLTQGRYRMGTGAAHAGLSFQIEKSWGLSGVRTTAGISFQKSLGSEAPIATTVFVGIGKTFTNDRGEQVGSIDLVGSQEIGTDRSDWMIALKATFSF